MVITPLWLFYGSFQSFFVVFLCLFVVVLYLFVVRLHVFVVILFHVCFFSCLFGYVVFLCSHFGSHLELFCVFL